MKRKGLVSIDEKGLNWCGVLRKKGMTRRRTEHVRSVFVLGLVCFVSFWFGLVWFFDE